MQEMTMRKVLVIGMIFVFCCSLVLADDGITRECPCEHVEGGDTCGAAIRLSGTQWGGIFNLCDYCNDYDLSPCTNWYSDASDVVLQISLNSGELNDLYILVVPSTSWDIAVTLVTNCGDFGPASCVCGRDVNGPGWPEACDLRGANGIPDGEYFIVVSGAGTSCGQFSICVYSDHELPVELVSFKGRAGNQEVRLTWETASETENDHFYLLRSTDQRNFARASDNIPASNSATGWAYTHVDHQLTNATTYFYKLVDVDINGVENVNDIVVEVTPSATTNITPDAYALHQNYPNPFNPNTTISYDIKEAGIVTLTIFDILGREVVTLVNTLQQQGFYSVEYDASKLTSGIYFYQLTVNDFVDLKKMVLLK